MKLSRTLLYNLLTPYTINESTLSRIVHVNAELYPRGDLNPKLTPYYDKMEWKEIEEKVLDGKLVTDL